MKTSIPLFVALLLFNFAALAVPISGQVVGPNGAPVADAKVIYSSNYANLSGLEYQSYQTNDAGEFFFEATPQPNIPNFFGRVIVHKSGLAVAEIMLRKEATTIRLEKAASARGRLVNADGKPVAGIVIELGRVERGGENPTVAEVGWTPLKADFTAQTDADGNWTIGDLPDGARAEIGMDDPRFVRLYVEVPVGLDAPPLLARPGATIAGRVLFADGKPAPDVEVSLDDGHAVETAQDGTYRITGLPTGAIRIHSFELSGQWIAPESNVVAAREGETFLAPDIVLTHGALVEGIVTDAQTGQPLSHAAITVTPVVEGAAVSIGRGFYNDANGHYQLRVPPGRYEISISRAPEGYLPSKNPADKNTIISVGEGETKTHSFPLSAALSLSGVAVDENGQAATNATLSLSGDQRAYNYENPTATTDEKGAFEFKSLRAGAHRLLVEGAWEVVAPEDITLPVAEKLRVVLRPLTLFSLVGRALTPDKKPVAGLAVSASITPATRPGPKGITRIIQAENKTAQTDARGHFVMQGIRPDSTVKMILSTPNYRFVEGGEVSQQDGRFVAADIIALPLMKALKGRILDEAGAPVVSAEVLAPRGSSTQGTLSNANGEFVLDHLPAGEVLVVAAKDGYLATARGAGEIEIVLHKAKTQTFDLWRAYNVLQEGMTQSRDDQYKRGDLLPGVLAAHDPDLALQLATDPYGHISNRARADIIVQLAKVDPATASIWALPQLELLDDPTLKIQTALTLISRLAPVAPETAAQFYEGAKKERDARPEPASDWEQVQILTALGVAASKLKSDEGALWLDQALTISLRSTEDYRSQMITDVLKAMAPFDPQGVEKLALQLPANGNYPLNHTLGKVIIRLARVDLAAALRLLKKLEARDKEQPQNSIAREAQRAVAVALAKTDLDAALKLARSIKALPEKALALAQIAALSPPEKRAALFREGFEAAPSYDFAKTGSYVAALAFNADPALGRELFAEVIKRTVDGDFMHGDGRKELAFYLSRADPAAARLLLEREYCRVGNYNDPHSSQGALQAIAMAMAALDADRALEIALTIAPHEENNYQRFAALRSIAQYLLMNDEKRAVLRFEDWSSSDYDLNADE